MKRFGTSVTAIILSLVMIFVLVPVQAFASVLENSSEYNEEVLEAIKNVVGSEDEAELYYDLMEHYGLLDETGNMAESWSIRMDSRDITLAELKEVLAGDYDPDKYIIVDETPVTLGDVATMIEIEEYVAYIRDTYFIDGEWTQAQKDSYDSLVEQVQTRGIRFTNPGSGSASGSTVSQEGLDQGARITFTRTGDLEFRADLIGAAPGQEAVFEYSFVPVTCERSDGEGGYFVITKTMQAGGDGTASVSVDPDLPDGVTYRALDKDAQGSYLMLSIRAVKDCLFINEDGQDCDAMYIPVFIENSSQLPFNTIGTVRIPAWQGVSVTNNVFWGWELPCAGGLSDVQKDLDKVLRAIDHGYYSSFKLELTARVEIEDQYYKQGELPVATGGTIKRNTEQDSKEGSDYYHTTTLSWNQSQYVTDIGIPIGEGNGTFKYKGKQGGRHIYELTFTTDPEHAAYWAQWFNKDHPSERELLSYRHTLTVEDAAVVYGSKTYSWELSGATVVIYDDAAPHTVSVWKASGEYLPGMGIPLYVQFSEAVQAESTTITLNGRTIPALAGTGLSDKQVFIYPVGELDAATLRMTGYYTKDAFGNIGDPSGSNYSVVIDGVSMKTPVKTHTFTGIGASVNSVIQNVYTIDVFADISKDPGMTAWLISELEEDPESSKARYKGLFYTLYIPGLTDPDDPDTLLYNGDIHTIWDLEGGLEGTVTGGRFCSQVQLDLRRYFSDHTEPLECVFALYSGELDQNNVAHVEPIFGKTCSLTINPPKLVTQNDMKIRLTVDYPDPDLNDIDMTFPREGETDMYRLSVNLAGEPTIRAQIVLSGNDFTFGDTTHTTIYDPAYTNGRTMDASAHFLWALDGAGRDASDYARIDKDGYIYPTGMPGNFYVIACAMGGYAGSVPSTFGNFILEFDEGYSPYLSIPNAAKEIDVISGAPANIYWSSNIVRKNGYNPTTFRVTVRVAQSENLPMDGLIYETYVTGDIGAPVSGVSIPGNYLNYQYYNATYNNFIVTVSTTYDGTEYSASVPLNVLSLPANVEFHNIGSLYVVDTVGSTDINWTITNFEQYSSGENLFEMRIARSGGRDETVITDPGQDDGYGTYAGSYTLQIPDVMADPSDPSSYRDVYVVTIKAKNGTDSTWSYDSFMLYVYDRDALDILVDGEHVGDSFTMSNRSSISQMTSEQILALKRDISLHNVISANYGEYAWAELADKMEWESSDNSVATINYQQGGVYDDIRNYNYTSYRPSADFVLSGLGDGTSDITVTHVRTGMTDTLTVNVETLRNRLYLFQFYPKVRTQVKYTDGTGAVKTVYTDSDGALAVYEESGIKGMISCSSAVTDGEEEKVYFGTFKSDNLLSGEADPTKLELYPCNRLELRQAAYAYIYIKNPDGTPYTGDISMRGGVYVDDVYQSGAKFSFNSSDIPSLSGDEDRVVALGENGRLTILMDRMQWAAGDALDTASRIRYVFLIRPYPDNAQVYPMFVNMDASLNMKAFISSGQSIVNFRANGSGSRHPFIIEQFTEAGGIRKDVLHTNSRIGISDTAPSCTLTSVALWWGEAAGDASENTLQLYSADGKKLAVGENDHTTYSTGEVYPFIEEEMTTYTVTLSQDNLAQTIPSGTK